jgi:D-3-phosphoglycerate dehydrogenase
LRYLEHGVTAGTVNFPVAELPVREGTHRIQHIHRNVPGVLGDVHRIVAAHGANVLGQVLVTDPAMGYLLMDVEEDAGANIVEDIAKLPTTLRARLLY